MIRLIMSLLFSANTFAATDQVIDSLQTDEQVLSFITALNGNYKNISLRPPKRVFGLQDYQKRINQFGSVSYEKADFDRNGLTDLLFNGYQDDEEDNGECSRLTLVIMSFPNDSIQIHQLTLGFFISFFTARTLNINGQTFIRTLTVKYNYNSKRRQELFEERYDTLTYRFSTFLETSKEVHHQIQGITYCVCGGLGGSAPFRLNIFGDSVSMSIGEYLRSPKSSMDSGGVFIAKIDSITVSRLYGILDYINFTNLKNAYASSSVDDLEGFITIIYDKGKIKKVSDRGHIGTYGLAALEKIFMELIDAQHWKKISTDNSFYFCTE